MDAQTLMSSPQRNARIAGALYLLLLPLGFFGMFVSSGIVVPGDAAATASHILASEPLYRLSIVVALVVQVVNVLVVLALYRLLQPVNKSLAVLMAVFLLLGVPIAMLNEAIQFGILGLVHSSSTGQAFSTGQLQALLPWLLDLHQAGINIAGVFWGLWLFPMGILVFKSGFLPKILGVLLIIGCLGYLVDSFAAFLFPGFGVNLAMFTFWGEVLLPLWLLIKGVNVEKWQRLALASA